MSFDYPQALSEEVGRSDDRIYNSWPDPAQYWSLYADERIREPFYEHDWLCSEAYFVALDCAHEALKAGLSSSVSEAVDNVFPLLAQWRQAVQAGAYYPKRFDLWFRHIGTSLDQAEKASKAASRPDLELVASQYLSSSIRSKVLERSLIRALIGIELVDYMDASNASRRIDAMGQSFLSKALFRHPTPRLRREKERCLISSMLNAYGCVECHSVVPVANLIEAVGKAEQAGVVWPGALLVLLHDLTDRRVTFLPLVRYHP